MKNIITNIFFELRNLFLLNFIRKLFYYLFDHIYENHYDLNNKDYKIQLLEFLKKALFHYLNINLFFSFYDSMLFFLFFIHFKIKNQILNMLQVQENYQYFFN